MVEIDEFPDRHATVDTGTSDPATLIEAAKFGVVWNNVREAMNRDPLYKPWLDHAYAKLQERMG